MYRKIQFHTFHLLFRFFSYLADKSGGWGMFVRPKLVIGAFIISFGVTPVDAQKTTKPVLKSKQYSHSNDSVFWADDHARITCYESVDTPNITDLPYIIVEQMPEFPGGKDVMKDFIAKNMVYPREALNNKIEGNIICSFIVDKAGFIDSIEIVRAVHPLLDAEAVRIIKSFPKWSPGKQKGVYVRVKYTIIIRFKLPTK